MTRPRPLVPRGDPADSVRVVGEFGVIARVLAQAGTSRAAEVGPGRRRRGRCGPPTAGSSRPPTSSSRAGTSGATGRRRRTSGTRRPRPTSPTSPPWAASATALLVGLACPPDTPTAWLEGVAAGLAAECAPLGAAVVGGDLVASARRTARSVVLSVTALGDLGGPARRCCGRGPVPATSWRWPGGSGWAACGLAVLRRGFSSPLAVVAAHRRPTPPYAAGPAAADAGAHRDVRRQRRAARRRSGTSPRTAAWSSTWTGRRSCAPAWNRPGPLQQVGVGARRRPAGLGADRRRGPRAAWRRSRPRAALPEGWTAIGAVRAGGEEDRGVRGRRAGRGRRARRSARRERGMSTSAEAAVPGCATARRSRLRALPYDDPVAAGPGRAGSSRSTSQRYGGRDEAVVDPAEFVPPAGALPRRRGGRRARPAAAPGGRCRAGRRRDQAGLRRAGVPPARAGAADRGRARGAARRAAGHRSRRAQHRRPAARGAGAVRATSATGRCPATACTPARRARCSWARICASDDPRSGPTGRRSGHGRRDGLGRLRRGRSGGRARRGRAARACPSTTGRSRPRSPGGSGCRSRRPRPTTRPSSAGCGGWSPRSGTMPDPVGGVLPTSALPDARAYRQQTERVLAEIADGAGGVVLGRAGGAGARRPAGRAARAARRAAASGGWRRPSARSGPAAARRSAARWRPTTAPARPTCGTSTGATRAAARHYHLVRRQHGVRRWTTVVDLVVTAARARGIGAPLTARAREEPRRSMTSGVSVRRCRGPPRAASAQVQARTTLPARMHEVHALIRRRLPGAISARTDWMFGFQRRGVRRCECDTDIPKPGPLPHTSHTAATVDHSQRIVHRRRGKAAPAARPSRQSNRSVAGTSPRPRDAAVGAAAMTVLSAPDGYPPPVLQALDDAAVGQWYRTAVEALSEARSRLDELNVFPVPDGDTGTNLLLTAQAAVAALDREGAAHRRSRPGRCSPAARCSAPAATPARSSPSCCAASPTSSAGQPPADGPAFAAALAQGRRDRLRRGRRPGGGHLPHRRPRPAPTPRSPPSTRGAPRSPTSSAPPPTAPASRSRRTPDQLGGRCATPAWSTPAAPGCASSSTRSSRR